MIGAPSRNPYLRKPWLLAALLLAAALPVAQARTVYRCVQQGTVSLATAPEPGSKCEARTVDDNAVAVPNLWGAMGVVQGTLYERQQDGRTVYSTRNLPGSIRVLGFTVRTPPGSSSAMSPSRSSCHSRRRRTPTR